MLLQRFDPIQRLAGLSTVPVIEQFRLMKDASFVDEAERARAQGAFKDQAVIDSNRSLFAAVLRVKMGRRMVVVVHRDDDPEEAAQLWHLYLPVVSRADIIAPRRRDAQRLR